MKAKRLRKDLQAKVARFYCERENTAQALSYDAVALHFTQAGTACTSAQVRNYVAKYKRGDYSKSKREELEKMRVRNEAREEALHADIDAIVEQEYKSIIVELQTNTELSANARTTLIKELTNIREKIVGIELKEQQLSLQKHMGFVDASFLFELCKYFNPGIDESEAIKVCKSVRVNMKVDK